MDDYQCFLKFEPKTQESILVASTKEVLKKAIEKTIQELQKRYVNPDFDFHYIVTIIDPHITGGIPTPNFSLRKNSSEVAKKLIDDFENYLTSNQEMEISPNFAVTFKVSINS